MARRVAAIHGRRAQARRFAGAGAGVSGSHSGAHRDAHRIRERRDAPGPDHRMTQSDVDLLIVGGGPCGLAAAISAQRAKMKVVVLESAAVVSTIAQYPTYVRFFSTAEKLSLGDV